MANNELHKGNGTDETGHSDKDVIQLVVFELDKEEYGVKITDLHGIEPIPEITPIPNAPDFISGIINLRGKIVVVVDLEKRFNLVREHPLEEKGNIIIAEVNENNFGVIVDKVNQIITVTRADIQPTPALVSTKINSDYLEGVIPLEERGEEKKAEENGRYSDSSRLIIMLDIKKMLHEEELMSLTKSAEKIGGN